MTQKDKDLFSEWLKERFRVLTNNDIELIVRHVDHYYAKEKPKVEKDSYDDESPEYITGNEDGI